MEEATQVQNAPLPPEPPQPTTTETLNSVPKPEPFKQRPSATEPQVPPKVATKKRPLDEKIEKSSYFKMRVVLKEIRPRLLETLRSKDYQSCKGAVEIREKLKLLIELNRQMLGTSRPKDVPEVKPFSGQNGSRRKLQEQLYDVKIADNSNHAKTSGNRSFQSITGMKPPANTNEIPWSYVVGGSAFGWNFITYTGNQPTYYGRTKEQFRASS